MIKDNFEFKGADYAPDLDKTRLLTQAEKIWHFMLDKRWHTLKEIEQATGSPQASASAALRAFRRLQNGNHIVNRRRRGDPKDGLFEYLLIPRETVIQANLFEL